MERAYSWRQALNRMLSEVRRAATTERRDLPLERMVP
jgi:hypothetical protein